MEFRCRPSGVSVLGYGSRLFAAMFPGSVSWFHLFPGSGFHVLRWLVLPGDGFLEVLLMPCREGRDDEVDRDHDGQRRQDRPESAECLSDPVSLPCFPLSSHDVAPAEYRPSHQDDDRRVDPNGCSRSSHCYDFSGLRVSGVRVCPDQDVKHRSEDCGGDG